MKDRLTLTHGFFVLLERNNNGDQSLANTAHRLFNRQQRDRAILEDPILDGDKEALADDEACAFIEGGYHQFETVSIFILKYESPNCEDSSDNLRGNPVDMGGDDFDPSTVLAMDTSDDDSSAVTSICDEEDSGQFRLI